MNEYAFQDLQADIEAHGLVSYDMGKLHPDRRVVTVIVQFENNKGCVYTIPETDVQECYKYLRESMPKKEKKPKQEVVKVEKEPKYRNYSQKLEDLVKAYSPYTNPFDIQKLYIDEAKALDPIDFKVFNEQYRKSLPPPKKVLGKFKGRDIIEVRQFMDRQEIEILTQVHDEIMHHRLSMREVMEMEQRGFLQDYTKPRFNVTPKKAW